MTLRTYDKQSAEGLYFIALGLNLSLVFFIKLGENFSCVYNFFIIGFRKAGCLVYKLLAETLTCHFVLCHVFGISAEHNIRSSTCHVGSNGYSALFTCLSNDFRFFFMEFSIQHLVADTLTLKQCA